ncbi:MAG: hypothetical protein JO172_01570, partial [Hyphomicrobiales bacterium]|nr:hypothetical protein [Hyphomicrobiales bacterium]
MALPRVFLSICAAGLIVAVSSAVPLQAIAAGCDENGATRVEVARVSDDLDIILKDERSVRL